MNRAAAQLLSTTMWVLRRPSMLWENRKWKGLLPRPAYCDCCGVWSWSTWELAVYTLESYGYLCEPCAEQNDTEWRYAWAEYYGGLL